MNVEYSILVIASRVHLCERGGQRLPPELHLQVRPQHPLLVKANVLVHIGGVARTENRYFLVEDSKILHTYHCFL